MKIYLVGGAVRDQMLGLPVKERDWVVVGASVEDMLAKGFRQVGKDFPVFLHPETQEEYALARTERKVGRGYTGFTFNTAPNVTLEEDLSRRDLTINAMAQTPDGQLIDPYGGKEDIAKKLLRHVSPAFVEDPVRILRVARFAARYAALGFTIAPDTLELMQRMVLAGEVDALVAERVWKELERAFGEKNPEVFFQVLQSCNAYTLLFPELALTALKQASEITADTTIRFAVLFHQLSIEEIKTWCDRYRIPSEYRELALLVASHGDTYQNIRKSSPEKILNLLLAVDAFRREARFKKFLLGCESITHTQHSEFLFQCYSAAKNIDTNALIQKGHAGKELADQIKAERISKIEKFLSPSQ